MSRTRLLAVLVAAALCTACLAVSDGGRIDRAAEPTPDTPSPSPTASPSASPRPSPTPADPMVFVRVQFEDDIDDGELTGLAAIPGVTGVLARQEDDGALWASRQPDGTLVDDLPTDFKVPVALEVERPALGLELAAGEVALTTAGAQFRDLEVGATVVLTDRTERTVVAITDDPALDDVEFVVAAEDATALAVRPRQRALLRLAPGSDVETAAAAAADLLGPDTITRARVPDGRPFVLSLPATKARFGEFAFRDLPGRDIQVGVSWSREHIVEERIPVLGRVRCHRDIIQPLVDVMEDLQERGLAGEVDPELYGGCWVPRRVNRNANLSRHAWGIGIDVNVDFDEPGLGPIPSPGVIAAFERHGFRWGGEYPVPDNHHFEWVGTDG